MCGFAAFFKKNYVFAPNLLDSVDRDLFHRGPDSNGRIEEPGCAMVFRRLAILDPVKSSDQPMVDPTGRFAIVFNGEIYNFKDLRQLLSKKGVKFRSKGDTEVILAGYMQWGEGILNRLEGMYAFVIWDREKKVVIAARDPLGIKPLYIARQGDFTGFSSEARPLRRIVGTEPDPQALSELLIFRFAGGRLSNYKNIDLLPGGTVVRFYLATGQYQERRFYDILETLSPQKGMCEKEALGIIENQLTSSVKAHLQSDVGYALQLSGGIDSSLIAALVRDGNHGKLRSFGINLGNIPQDESDYRRIVVEKLTLNHTEVHCSNSDFADALPRAIAHMEGPSPHFGCVMLMLLCDKIRETDKVILTGEGADELFGGYARYEIWKKLRLHGRLAKLVPSWLWPFLKRYRSIQRYAEHDPAIVSSIYFDFLRMFELFPELVPSLGARERTAARFSDFRDRMMAVDQTAYLSSLLMRQDKMSMAASVEARVPFVHLPVFKAINRIPQNIRIPGGVTKPLLKKFAAQWFPKQFIDRRKVGLNLPLEEWLDDESGFGRYLDMLAEPNAHLATYTDSDKLQAIVDAFREKKRNELPNVPHLINMELWLRSIDTPIDTFKL